MKVICDVHISRKVVGFFQSQGVEAIHVNDILEGSETKDYLIAGYADQYGFVVISKDADFKNDHLIKGSPKRLEAIYASSFFHLLDNLKAFFFQFLI